MMNHITCGFSPTRRPLESDPYRSLLMQLGISQSTGGPGESPGRGRDRFDIPASVSRPPQPLDEDVAEKSAVTIHGDAHPGVLQACAPRRASGTGGPGPRHERAALVCVEGFQADIYLMDAVKRRVQKLAINLGHKLQALGALVQSWPITPQQPFPCSRSNIFGSWSHFWR